MFLLRLFIWVLPEKEATKKMHFSNQQPWQAQRLNPMGKLMMKSMAQPHPPRGASEPDVDTPTPSGHWAEQPSSPRKGLLTLAVESCLLRRVAFLGEKLSILPPVLGAVAGAW